MYKTVMVIAVAVLAVWWIGYAIWRIRENRLEKKRPRARSQHLRDSQRSMDDYAKEMEKFGEKKPYKR